jgi:hypothetical protein
MSRTIFENLLLKVDGILKKEDTRFWKAMFVSEAFPTN